VVDQSNDRRIIVRRNKRSLILEFRQASFSDLGRAPIASGRSPIVRLRLLGI
jgi:hypothetical protein